MTEVNDGARILRRHVEELQWIGVIDDEQAAELNRQIREVQTAIENYYDEV